ncbi:MAG: putative 4-hydroxybenzoate polyprenyltransferase [Vicinamibacteria bacterium]|nr:putative 4-hydroxybenzoate polyprenyltransferase [Vicinamibacteria bacterium]
MATPAAGAPPPSLLGRLASFGRMIKFSHSIFAMPFALAAFALAVRREGFDAGKLLWVIVAMVSARSAAMGFNRWLDAEIDAKNPRTASRELPSGILSKPQVLAFVVASIAVFVGAAWRLNPLCFALSPVALVIVCGYSFTKRFTMLSHMVLGLSLAIAPVGAWLAVRGQFEVTPIPIGLAVLFWVGGFDILYSCQDVEFDHSLSLHSIPVRFGVPRALRLARAAHVLAIAFLLTVPLVEPLHWSYFAGMALVFGLFGYEHSLVTAEDLSRIDAAFFTVNGWIGVLYLVTVLIASLLK